MNEKEIKTISLVLDIANEVHTLKFKLSFIYLFPISLNVGKLILDMK